MSKRLRGFMVTILALGLVLALGACARTLEGPLSDPARVHCVRDASMPQAPANIRLMSNPMSMTAESMAAGRRLYQETARPMACAQCHGTNGDGQGPLASRLDPAPSNFTCDFYRHITDGQLFWITREGSSVRSAGPGHADVRRPGRRDRVTAMQPHRYFLSEEETWQVIVYLRSFHTEVP